MEQQREKEKVSTNPITCTCKETKKITNSSTEFFSLINIEKSTKLATNCCLTYANVLTSGFSEILIETDNYKMANGIGYTVSKALKQAKIDDRLVVGLSQAVKTLSIAPEDTIFCVLAQPKAGDSATHMQLILLEAFCYENGIYTIKVDDPEKMCTIAGASKLESCVLVQRYKHINGEQMTKLKFFDAEERLVDHCEDHWDVQPQPIIRLPDE